MEVGAKMSSIAILVCVGLFLLLFFVVLILIVFGGIASGAREGDRFGRSDSFGFFRSCDFDVFRSRPTLFSLSSFLSCKSKMYFVVTPVFLEEDPHHTGPDRWSHLCNTLQMELRIHRIQRIQVKQTTVSRLPVYLLEAVPPSAKEFAETVGGC